jgi:hypothetical protein
LTCLCRRPQTISNFSCVYPKRTGASWKNSVLRPITNKQP